MEHNTLHGEGLPWTHHCQRAATSGWKRDREVEGARKEQKEVGVRFATARRLSGGGGERSCI